MVLIRGVELSLHPDGEAFSDHIKFTNDFYEAEILDYLRLNFPTHGTIVDIGANIGNHSAYFASFLKYRQIIAFEPVPDNYILLTQNCAHFNGFYPFKLGITDQEKILEIEPNKGNMGASAVREGGIVEVIGIPLDRLALYDVSLIKIDVEWHEPEVLAGAYATIYRNKPLILIEDVKDEYEYLLPGYSKIESWEKHGTYLYQWSR